MRRVFAFAFVLSAAGGCTAILGTYDTGADAGPTKDGSTATDGASDTGILVGDAAPPFQADATSPLPEAGSGACNATGTPVPIATGAYSSFVRVYHTASGVVRVVDLSASNINIVDITNGSATVVATQAFQSFLTVRHLNNGLTFLVTEAGTTSGKVTIARIEDDETSILIATPSGTVVGTTAFSSGSVIPTGVGSLAGSPSFIALGEKSAEALDIENLGTTGPVHTLYSDPAGNPLLTEVLSVIDDGTNVHIFTPGDINNSIQPSVFVTPDKLAAATTMVPPTNILPSNSELIDVSPIDTGHIGTTGVQKANGSSSVALLSQVVTDITTFDGMSMTNGYTFASELDLPAGGDSRWVTLGLDSMLVLAGGVPPASAGQPPAAKGLNLIWWNETTAKVVEDFTEKNRLFTDTDVLGASATVNGVNATTSTIDIVYAQPAAASSTDVTILYQQVTCTF